MAVLVGYGSSDEEDDEVVLEEQTFSTKGSEPPVDGHHESVSLADEGRAEEEEGAAPDRAADAPCQAEAEARASPMAMDSRGSDVMIGPARPDVSGLSSAHLLSLDEDEDDNDNERESRLERPLSPYSTERALLRELTMPRVPDFAIPGSPPPTASPPPGLAALDGKLSTFLALKRDKATHFHERLAQSAAMKNPAVMDKLMAFVGMGGEPDGGGLVGQYGTVLPAEVWNPVPTDETNETEKVSSTVFPPWAYRQQLRKVQDEQARKRARAPGERVAFVSAGVAETGKRRSRFD